MYNLLLSISQSSFVSSTTKELKRSHAAIVTFDQLDIAHCLPKLIISLKHQSRTSRNPFDYKFQEDTKQRANYNII